MRLKETLFFLFLIFLSVGQLGKIPLPFSEVNFYLPDLFLVLLILSFAGLLFRRRKELLRLPLTEPILCFWFISFLSQLCNLSRFSPKETLVGSLYLFRWVAYSFVYFCSYLTVLCLGKRRLIKVLLLGGILFAFLGFLQLLLVPDFSVMAKFGWDPHYYRLLSTFFDPNFAGGFLFLSLSLATAFYLFEKEKIILVFIFLLYLALVLTYSRSSYFAFLLGMLAFGVLKEKKVFFIALLAFFLSLQINPRVKSRVEGAVTVDQSASHRLNSWQIALFVIKRHPFFGVGFNNYRYAQLKYGFVDPKTRGGHSGAGTDSSFLFVWATTGLFGLFSYLWLLSRAFFHAFLRGEDDFFSLASFASLFGFLFHSQFVNSLFFPPIMGYLWTILGASGADEKTD